MTCSIETKCSLIAAANVIKGKSYNVHESLTENTGIDSPLLSRFDLILLLVDSKNIEWDEKLSGNLLGMISGSHSDSMDVDDSASHADQHETPLPFCWTFDILRKYFWFVKNLKPVLTKKASDILSAYYRKRKRQSEGSENKLTTRMLESLIRQENISLRTPSAL